MTWIVSTEVINPWGFCVEEPIYIYGEKFGFDWRVDVIDPITGNRQNHRLYIDIDKPVSDYIRRVYNLPDDTGVDVRAIYSTESEFGEVTYPLSWGFINTSSELRSDAKSFSTEAEALEYVDTLGNPDPIITIPYNNRSEPTLFTATWYEEIDGVRIRRTTDLKYTGDQVTLYTINDLVNFLALFCGVTPEEVPIVWYFNDPPSLDCETSLKATVVDVDGPIGPIEIDIDFTGGSIPGDVTVTTIDGDPVVSNTMIENGDGSVTIHDNGNIIMSNDGGTFFLNEFGNVGFYANNDASPTANTQVQLGVGGTSITVENDCFTFRDGTGNVELTADELTRLKALLG